MIACMSECVFTRVQELDGCPRHEPVLVSLLRWSRCVCGSCFTSCRAERGRTSWAAPPARCRPYQAAGPTWTEADRHRPCSSPSVAALRRQVRLGSPSSVARRRVTACPARAGAHLGSPWAGARRSHQAACPGKVVAHHTRRSHQAACPDQVRRHRRGRPTPRAGPRSSHLRCQGVAQTWAVHPQGDSLHNLHSLLRTSTDTQQPAKSCVWRGG